jgi:hypothetical protein
MEFVDPVMTIHLVLMNVAYQMVMEVVVMAQVTSVMPWLQAHVYLVNALIINMKCIVVIIIVGMDGAINLMVHYHVEVKVNKIMEY